MRTSLWIDCHWIQPWRLPWWPSLTSKCSFENSPFKTLKLKLLKFTNNVLGDWRKSVMQFTKLWYMRQIFHSLIWFHSLWIVRIQVSCGRKFNRLKCLDHRTKNALLWFLLHFAKIFYVVGIISGKIEKYLAMIILMFWKLLSLTVNLYDVWPFVMVIVYIRIVSILIRSLQNSIKYNV